MSRPRKRVGAAAEPAPLRPPAWDPQTLCVLRAIFFWLTVETDAMRRVLEEYCELVAEGHSWAVRKREIAEELHERLRAHAETIEGFIGGQDARFELKEMQDPTAYAAYRLTRELEAELTARCAKKRGELIGIFRRERARRQGASSQ